MQVVERVSVGRRAGRAANDSWFGSAEAASAYARFCPECWANQGHAAPELGMQTCVAELALRYLDWAKDYYRNNGRPTSEIHRIRSVLKSVTDIYGDTATEDFLPRQRIRYHGVRCGAGQRLRFAAHDCGRSRIPFGREFQHERGQAGDRRAIRTGPAACPTKE